MAKDTEKGIVQNHKSTMMDQYKTLQGPKESTFTDKGAPRSTGKQTDTYINHKGDCNEDSHKTYSNTDNSNSTDGVSKKITKKYTPKGRNDSN